MSTNPREARDILEHNTGFDTPALWVDYAQAHAFTRIKAVRVDRCPDCSASPGRRWGQYVYYSTLIHLVECARCGLIWSDAHLDPNVLQRHFESAYKDDEYFRRSRRAIFDHLATVIVGLSPRGARILDVGGARGDLMHTVVARRPDVRPTVHDISNAAAAWAATHFGFTTLVGGADELAAHSTQYDVVVLSDVLYYEPKLPVLWLALSRLIRPGGAIVIRVPNRALLMRLGQIWFRWSRTRKRRLLQDHIPYFNPEHIFVLRRRYLEDRLRSIGFAQVQAVPSPLLSGSPHGILHDTFFGLALVISRLSRGRVVLTPSMLLVARDRRAIERA